MSIARNIINVLNETLVITPEELAAIKKKIKSLETRLGNIKLKVTLSGAKGEYGVNIYITQAPFYFMEWDTEYENFVTKTGKNNTLIDFSGDEKITVGSISGERLDKKDWFETTVYNKKYYPILQQIFNAATLNSKPDKTLYDVVFYRKLWNSSRKKEHPYNINIYQGDTKKPFIYTGG